MFNILKKMNSLSLAKNLVKFNSGEICLRLLLLIFIYGLNKRVVKF